MREPERIRLHFRNGIEISAVHLGGEYPIECWVMKGDDREVEHANMHCRDSPLPTQPRRYTTEEFAKALHLWTYYMMLTNFTFPNGGPYDG